MLLISFPAMSLDRHDPDIPEKARGDRAFVVFEVRMVEEERDFTHSDAIIDGRKPLHILMQEISGGNSGVQVTVLVQLFGISERAAKLLEKTYYPLAPKPLLRKKLLELLGGQKRDRRESAA